jgi:hypothetical protein
LSGHIFATITVFSARVISSLKNLEGSCNSEKPLKLRVANVPAEQLWVFEKLENPFF